LVVVGDKQANSQNLHTPPGESVNERHFWSPHPI
jgi:hypothetical protein